MRRKLFPTLALGILATLAAAQGVGTELPAIELKGLAQTEAASFDDFLGRTVLLEFWAEWCGPCASAVPHLNELHAKYAEQGLSIIGVTSSRNDANKTQRFIDKRKVRYAWAWDVEDKLLRHFGIRGIPHSVLVDANGVVAWRGSPRALTDEMIEMALVGALKHPLWKWPAGSEEVEKALRDGRMADALSGARQLEGAAGAEVAAALQETVDARMAVIREAWKNGDYVRVDVFGRSVLERFKGLPEEKELNELLAELAKPEIQTILAAQRTLAGLVARARTAKSRDALRAVIGEMRGLEEKHAGTIVAEQAGDWADIYERRMKL